MNRTADQDDEGGEGKEVAAAAVRQGAGDRHSVRPNYPDRDLAAEGALQGTSAEDRSHADLGSNGRERYLFSRSTWTTSDTASSEEEEHRWGRLGDSSELGVTVPRDGFESVLMMLMPEVHQKGQVRHCRNSWKGARQSCSTWRGLARRTTQDSHVEVALDGSLDAAADGGDGSSLMKLETGLMVGAEVELPEPLLGAYGLARPKLTGWR